MEIYVSKFLPLFILTLMLVLAFWDYKKRRRIKAYPLVSFIVPTYNDAKSLPATIKSIYYSYPLSKFELFVINDCSKDNTKAILKKLQTRYKFSIISNNRNIGKTKSINKTIPKTKGSYIFILDSDTLINKEATKDIFARFHNNKQLGAVSCRYKPKNQGFLPIMQEVDYNFQTLLNSSFNITSGIFLWGGCMVIKREALIEVGCFTVKAITEDIDLALKLNKKGWKVEQSFIPVKTHVPPTLKAFYYQRTRWISGAVQAALTHPQAYFKNPLAIIYLASYLLFITLTLVTLFNPSVTPINILELTSYPLNNNETIKPLVLKLFYLLFPLPPIIMLMKSKKNWLYFFEIFPFALLYYPLLMIIHIPAIIKGAVSFIQLKEGQIGWQG